MWRIGSVKADSVVVAILNPDPAQKAPARVVLGLNVNHDATSFSEKLLPHEFELVVFLLKISIEHDHLGEAQGQELAGKYVGKRVQSFELQTGLLFKKLVLHTIAQVKAPQKILIAGGRDD